MAENIQIKQDEKSGSELKEVFSVWLLIVKDNEAHIVWCLHRVAVEASQNGWGGRGGRRVVTIGDLFQVLNFENDIDVKKAAMVPTIYKVRSSCVVAMLWSCRKFFAPLPRKCQMDSTYVLLYRHSGW